MSESFDSAVITKKLFSIYGIRVCSGETYGIKDALRIRIGLRKSNLDLIRALKSVVCDQYE